jgi:hypothetical protein
MSALAVMGVALPVRIDSLKASLEPVGSERRNQRGHQVLERRRAKWVFDFELSPCPLDEAQMYRSLILGEGEFWSMKTSAYGSKGLGLTGTGGWVGSGGFNPIATNGVFKLTTGQTMIVPARLYSQSALGTAHAGVTGSTFFGWRYDETLANYRVFGWSWRAYASGVTHKREKIGALGSSGAVQNYTGSETFSVSNGNLTVTAPGSGGPWRFSNMTVLPWFCPQAQVDQLLEGLAVTLFELPRLPNVYVTTDLLPTEQHASPAGTNQSSLICNGVVDELEVVPLARDGSFSTTDCILRGSLSEV